MNMNVLFLHNNYPAQFLHVAAALAQNPHNRIVFLAQHNRRPELQLNNVRFVRVPAVTPPDTKDEAEKVAVVNLRTGQAYANAMLELAKTGFVPHVVHDHPGWGGSLRPDCHIVIMGDDKTHYSKPRSDGKTWGQAMREECPLDRNCVHFMNFSSYETYRNLLRISSVHVYLTIPFVLSWSLLEAMSCQCLIVASGTEPVREFIRHEENGLLTPFWDHEALAGTVVNALRQREEYEPLRKAARQMVLERCDLMKVLPQHLDVLEMAAFHKASLIQQYVARENEATAMRNSAPVEEPAG